MEREGKKEIQNNIQNPNKLNSNLEWCAYVNKINLFFQWRGIRIG